MARRIIIVEQRDGLLVSLIKLCCYAGYYIYIFPFVFLHRVLSKKKAAQLAEQQAQSQVVYVQIGTQSPAQSPQPRRVVCAYCQHEYLEGVDKCPECGATAVASASAGMQGGVSASIPTWRPPSTVQSRGTKPNSFFMEHPKVAIVCVVLGVLSFVSMMSKSGEGKPHVATPAVETQKVVDPAQVAEAASKQAAADSARLNSRVFLKTPTPDKFNAIVARELSVTGDPDMLWETKYQGKFVRWDAKYERDGIIVEFVASAGQATAVSCRTFDPAQDATTFKPARWQTIVVEGRLDERKGQFDKDKTEYVLTGCIARIR